MVSQKKQQNDEVEILANMWRLGLQINVIVRTIDLRITPSDTLEGSSEAIRELHFTQGSREEQKA